jgi:hypothetical protein
LTGVSLRRMALSGEHRHTDYEAAIAALGNRVTALEQTEPPVVEPPPIVTPPPVGGEARMKAALGIRTPGEANSSFDAFTKSFGREVKFYRAGGTHDADGPNLTMLTGNMWAHYVPSTDPKWGFSPKHPNVINSQILPQITGKSIPVEERAKRMRDTVAGVYDDKWDLMLVNYLGQSPKQKHRFNISNEPDNSGYFAYRLPDANEVSALPISLWRECFSYIADRVHAVGCLVVMTGNADWDKPVYPGGLRGYEWAACFNKYDIFAQNFYWMTPGSTTRAYAFHQLNRTLELAKSLNKPLAFPEYGVAQYVTPATPNPITSDAEIISYYNDVWDWMADLPATGAGSLDHHNLWNENGWRLKPAVFEVFKARLGG